MELTEKAQRVLDEFNKGIDVQDNEELIEIMQEWSCSDGFEYGLIDGGYVKPEDILKGKSLEDFQNALKVYKEFKELWDKISLEF